MSKLNNKTKSNYPHLFHIGTQRAGSTFLYNLLSSHPDVSLHRLSEVNFFSAEFSRGLNWYLSGFKGNKARIDTSPKYFMLGQTVAPRIKEYGQKYLGSQKPLFLLILRNPIDYLNLHFRMQLTQGLLGQSGKIDDLIEFIKAHPGYLKRAFYWEILSNYWFKYFEPEQFKIVIFEDFIKNTDKILAEILDFWRLPRKKLVSVQVSKNKIPKYRVLVKARSKIIKNEKLKRFLKQSKIFNYVYDKFLTHPSAPKLLPSQRKELKNIFASDVEALKEFLGKKIEAWEDFI